MDLFQPTRSNFFFCVKVILKYYKSISCGNDQLSNFSKLSNQERKIFLSKFADRF
jgi:hypothetical protein